MKDGEEVASAMKDLALNERILFRNGVANTLHKERKELLPPSTYTTTIPQNSPNFKR